MYIKTKSSNLPLELTTSGGCSSDAFLLAAQRYNVSRHRVECFLANFIPGTIGKSGGIEP